MTPWTAVCQASLSLGILQARILEWVSMPSSRWSSQTRNWTQVSHVAGRLFTVCVTLYISAYNKTYLLYNLVFLWFWKIIQLGKPVLSTNFTQGIFEHHESLQTWSQLIQPAPCIKMLSLFPGEKLNPWICICPLTCWIPSFRILCLDAPSKSYGTSVKYTVIRELTAVTLSYREPYHLKSFSFQVA